MQYIFYTLYQLFELFQVAVQTLLWWQLLFVLSFFSKIWGSENVWFGSLYSWIIKWTSARVRFWILILPPSKSAKHILLPWKHVLLSLSPGLCFDFLKSCSSVESLIQTTVWRDLFASSLFHCCLLIQLSHFTRFGKWKISHHTTIESLTI